MTEVGTIRQLNVKKGDVVEFVEWEDGNTVSRMFAVGKRYTHTGEKLDSERGYFLLATMRNHKFRIISRANDEPKKWCDMTPEEKGALLLAHHDGKVIEWASEHSGFSKEKPWTWHYCPNAVGKFDNYAYRVKPEPNVETVTVYGNPNKQIQWVFEECPFDTHRITFKVIDGKPDCASIQMEELK